MSKKRCKKKDYSSPEIPKYYCEKCNRLAKKEEQVCKPKKLKKELDLK
jgi:hypothetical protein